MPISTWLSSFSIIGSRQYLVVANLGDKGPMIRYDLSTGRYVDDFFTVEHPDPPNGMVDAAPYDLKKGPNGWLNVLTLNPREIWRFYESSGSFNRVLVNDLQKPNDWRQAFCIAFGPDGNLYLSTHAGTLPSEVFRFAGQTGAPLGMFVPTGSGGLQGALCIVFGPDGNLYAASDDMPGILRFNGSTGAFIDTFVSSFPHGQFVNPRSLAFGPDGHLYAIATAPRAESNQPDRINRYDRSTGTLLGAFVAPSTDMGRPISMAFGPDGNLYVGVTNEVGAPGSGSLYTGRIRVYHGTSGSFLGTLDPQNKAKLDYPISMEFVRVPVSIREIIFISRIPRWMWALGLGTLLGFIVGRGRRDENFSRQQRWL